VSAATNHDEQQAAEAAGADAFLPKPVTRAALRAALSDGFSRQRSGKRSRTPEREAGGGEQAGRPPECNNESRYDTDQAAEAAGTVHSVAGIDMEEALESAGGDPERLRERLHRFVSEYSQLPAALQRHLEQRDYAGARYRARTRRCCRRCWCHIGLRLRPADAQVDR